MAFVGEYDTEFSILEFSILSSLLDKFNEASVEIPSDGMYIMPGVNNKK